jgi:hypothetical protein
VVLQCAVALLNPLKPHRASLRERAARVDVEVEGSNPWHPRQRRIDILDGTKTTPPRSKSANTPPTNQLVVENGIPSYSSLCTAPAAHATSPPATASDPTLKH